MLAGCNEFKYPQQAVSRAMSALVAVRDSISSEAFEQPDNKASVVATAGKILEIVFKIEFTFNNL
jgi:hypothetical protein